jgi:hypothetical protein
MGGETHPLAGTFQALPAYVVEYMFRPQVSILACHSQKCLQKSNVNICRFKKHGFYAYAFYKALILEHLDRTEYSYSPVKVEQVVPSVEQLQEELIA